MNDGYIKVAAATIDISVADPSVNAAAATARILEADKQGVNLLVLPEMCITGYSCGDLFYSEHLISSAERTLSAICRETRGCGVVSAVGLPVKYGGKLFNCAVVISQGKILGVIPKQYLPNYGEFYEKRQFTSGFGIDGAVCRVELCGQKVPFGTGLVFYHEKLSRFSFGVEICEDLWAPCPPSCLLCESGANIIVNLSASNEVIGKSDYRRSLVTGTSARLLCGYIYASANATESTQDTVFSGHCMIAENGVMLNENPPFGEKNLIISEIDVNMLDSERRRNTDFPVAAVSDSRIIPFDSPLCVTGLTRHYSKMPFVPHEIDSLNLRARSILDIQSNGLKKRLTHTRAKSAVIGVSGGLDSTLALLVAVRAMRMLDRPMTDITAVTMPCFGTTQRTKSNAENLCALLGVTLLKIDITAAVRQHFSDLKHPENQLDVVFENSQARERTQVLMDIANQKNGLVVGTGDLSELALGWATYNGDHMSMYGVNASVPKTLVRHIVRYEAELFGGSVGEILKDILDTPVSPELLPADSAGDISQKTEDIVGPYILHDFFLYHMLRYGETPRKLFRLARYAFGDEYPSEEILKWLRVFTRRFFSQQFKRSCMPDGPKVGSVTLSPRGDWRMPSDASSAMWLNEIDKIEIMEDAE